MTAHIRTSYALVLRNILGYQNYLPKGILILIKTNFTTNFQFSQFILFGL